MQAMPTSPNFYHALLKFYAPITLTGTAKQAHAQMAFIFAYQTITAQQKQ